MDTTATNSEPPYYILYSHSSLSSNTPGALSVSLSHPTIQYHFLDDSPLSLLPQTADEEVIIMDYDPTSSSLPSVKSLSGNLVVSGLKVAEAPGALGDDAPRNDRMYILETTTTSEDKSLLDASQGEHPAPHAVLAQFKSRNALLRRALLYPDLPQEALQSPPPLHVSPRQDV